MNNQTKHTIAAVAAAAIAAGSIAVFTTDPAPDEQPAAAVVDDVQPVTVEIPRVEVPCVAAVTVSAATAPAISVNSFREVTLEVLEAAEVPPVQSAPLDVPGVPDLTADLPALVRLRSALLQLMRDQRTVMYATIRADDPLWQRWIDIYRSPEYANYVAEYRPLEPGLRIINEVKCPVDSSEFETLQARLDYYGKRGYNAVLVTFDTTENLARLCAAVDYIKSAGFRIVIAYAGREHLSEPVFRAPDVLRRWLATLGAKADALLLGWRRTSLHLFLPDKPFSNFLIRSAREGNPDLPFVGLAYFGETAKTLKGVTYDVPENCSAVLIAGLGYPHASTRTALQMLFPEVASHPHLIGLAVGERPYFDSLHDTGKTQAENDAIKRRIELRLLRAGCASTHSTITEFDAAGNVIRTTETSESVIKTVTASTQGKSVIAWEDGWAAYISASSGTVEDPTPHGKMFIGKTNKGALSLLPNQQGLPGIARIIQATKSDISASLTDGVAATSSEIQTAGKGAANE